MAVLRNRYPLYIPPAGADPLLKYRKFRKFRPGGHVSINPCTWGGTLLCMVQEAPLKIYARGVVSYFYFPARRPRACAENKANQQCHFKSSRWRMDPLGTDSCRGTVPMEPPMSNGSMRHQNPVGDFDDTGQIL
jgi:hypothetical protein